MRAQGAVWVWEAVLKPAISYLKNEASATVCLAGSHASSSLLTRLALLQFPAFKKLMESPQVHTSARDLLLSWDVGTC